VFAVSPVFACMIAVEDILIGLIAALADVAVVAIKDDFDNFGCH